MNLSFQYTIYIAKPMQEVWNALVEKATVDQYYMLPLHTLELHQGGKISYGGASEQIVGTVEQIEAPSLLAHSFHFSETPDAETLVTYQIDAVGEAMCSLRITHSGFVEENQTYADICGGWPVIASSLKTLLETGQTLPWPRVG